MVNLYRTLLPSLLTLVLVGCGGPRPYPVSGKIVFGDGTPATDLADFIISMDSVDRPEGATGIVQPDGTFKVGTQDNEDGALPGKYRVVLIPPDPPLDQPAPKRIIPPKYGSADTSGLEVEVLAQTNDITLTVERAQP